MNSLTTLPASWFSTGHGDRHFLASHIQRDRDSTKCFTVQHNFEVSYSVQVVDDSTEYLTILVQIRGQVLILESNRDTEH